MTFYCEKTCHTIVTIVTHGFMAGYGGKGSVCVGVGTGSDSMIRVLTREGTLAISPWLSPRPNKTRDTS